MLFQKYVWAIKKSLFLYTNQDSTFSHTRENSKMFNLTFFKKIFQLFQQQTSCKLSRTYNKIFSFMLFLFVLQFHDLGNLKSKVNKLDVDKSVLVPVGLSKLSDVGINDVVQKVVYNTKIKNTEDKIPDITNVATNTTLNTKINQAKNEIPSIAILATTIAYSAKINEVKTKYLILLTQKIKYLSNLVKKSDYNTKK